MYVRQLIVKGFKSLDDVRLQFSSGLNAIVGKNNCGKSNVIEALDMVLGERAPIYQTVEDRHFHVDDQGESADEFLICVRLSGGSISEELLINEDVGAYVRQNVSMPTWENSDDIREFEHNGTWIKAPALVNLLLKATDVWLCLIVPRNGRRKDRTFGCFVRSRIGPSDRSVFKIDYLYRFRDGLRDALLTTAKMPSFRDPGTQLRITNYTWYGQLVKALYDSATPEQVNQIKRLQNDLSCAINGVFDKTTKELKNKLSEAIFHHEISFRASAQTKDDAHKALTIFIDDGINAPYFDKGSGIQSALIMALFEHYCDHFHHGGSLLLAEEPELFLHPHARRMIEQRLRTFAAMSTDRSRQVIMTTHAAEFLRGLGDSMITLLHKPLGHTGTKITQLDPSNLPPSLQQRWKQIIVGPNAEMVFADYAILVEGGEEHVLRPLADFHFEKTGWMDFNNISLVRVDGKTQFADYSSILNHIGIPHVILADLDFLATGVNKFTTGMPEELRTELTRLQTLIRSAAKVKADKARDAFSSNTIDFLTLCKRVDHAIQLITSGEELTATQQNEIAELWKLLKLRAERTSIFELLSTSDEARAASTKLFAHFRSKGIWILQTGELEDYYTAQARLLNVGDPSKDRLAIAVGHAVAGCLNRDQVNDLLRLNEFTELLDHVNGELPQRRKRAIDFDPEKEPEENQFDDDFENVCGCLD